MELHQVFNLLLLTLTLATILLTLVSYVIYKFRQLPKVRNTDNIDGKVRGVYFVRYVPEKTGPKPESTYAPQKRSTHIFGVPKSAAVFFGLLAAVIFLSLMGQHLFSEYSLGSRGNSAKNYQDLMRSGLLRTYDYAPIDTTKILDEVPPPLWNANLARLQGSLTPMTFVIFESDRNHRLNSAASQVSVQAWKELFTAMGAHWKMQSILKLQGKDVVLVLPQQKLLSDPERKQIADYQKQGIPILATGPIGVLNGLGNMDPSHLSWIESVFGVRLSLTPEPGTTMPTQFVTDLAPWWEVPAGLLTQWFPLDNSFQAISENSGDPLLVASYTGVPVPGLTRARLRQTELGRTVWLGIDPIQIKEATSTERAYMQGALTHVLAWLRGVPLTRVASWKGAKKSVIAVSVDSEEKFENVERFLKIFNQFHLPATFFVVSDLFQKFPEMMTAIGPEMEIASHSENHELFQNQAQNRQFDRIQDSRLAIEEISKSRVLGFRPPSENYDSDSVSAAVGNRLAYFYGDRRFLRYSPAWVAQGRMLFYPRVLNDDFSLHKKRELSNPEEFLHTVMRDYGVAHSVGGAYLFGMHTHIFGLPGYEIVVRKIVEKLSAQNDSWSTHFSALTNWVSGRAHLESRIEGESGNQVLFVHNTGDAAIGGVVVEVDTGRKALPISVGQLGPGESRRIPIPSHP